MNDKWVLASLTIWGVIITLLGTLNIPVPFTEEEGEGIIHAIAVLVGTVMVIVGRFRATKPLGFRLN